MTYAIRRAKPIDWPNRWEVIKLNEYKNLPDPHRTESWHLCKWRAKRRAKLLEEHLHPETLETK